MRTLQERARTRKPGDSPVIQMPARLMIPFIQLFGLYVIVHGHYSPGGGFQGGVILGSSFILMAIAFDLQTTIGYLSERSNLRMANAGAFIFVGTGVLCALLGGLFLDYSALARIIPIDPVEWRSLGIFLVEVGVGLTVMNIMVSLYWDLGSAGRMDEGL